MAWKVISGGKKKTQSPIVQPQVAQPQQEEPGLLSQLGGSLANLGLSAATGAVKIPAAIGDLTMAAAHALPAPMVSDTGEIERPSLSPEQYKSLQLTPKVEAVSQDIRKKLPKSLELPGEKFINKVAESLPAFYLPGGGFQNAIARALGSETGKELVKSGGGGELAQFFGSLAGAGLAAGSLTRSNLKKLEALNYKDFEKSIPQGAKTNINLGRSSYDEALKNKRLLPGTSKWLKENLEHIEPILKSGKASTEDAYHDMKYLNRIIREEVPSITSKGVRDETKNVLLQISSGIKQDIVDSAKDNPGLYVKGLIDGSSISYARNNTKTIQKLLKYAGISGAATAGTGLLAGKALLGKVGAPLLGGAIAAQGILDPALMAARSPTVRQELLGRTLPQTLSGILSTLG